MRSAAGPPLGFPCLPGQPWEGARSSERNLAPLPCHLPAKDGSFVVRHPAWRSCLGLWLGLQ